MKTNKDIVLNFFNEVINGKKLSEIESFIHKDYTVHGFPVEAKGPEAMKQITGMMFSSFADIHVTMEGIIEENNSVGTHGYWTGSHNGEFMGIPATGKKVKVNFVEIWNIKDDKLHENWVQMDFTGLMKQL